MLFQARSAAGALWLRDFCILADGQAVAWGVPRNLLLWGAAGVIALGATPLIGTTILKIVCVALIVALNWGLWSVAYRRIGFYAVDQRATALAYLGRQKPDGYNYRARLSRRAYLSRISSDQTA